MGFYSWTQRAAKCPLFESFVRSKNEKISGIQCECLNSGLDASTIIRFHGFNAAMRHKRIYCDKIDGYQECPYYKHFESGQQ